jgi:hypothetical protein
MLYAYSLSNTKISSYKKTVTSSLHVIDSTWLKSTLTPLEFQSSTLFTKMTSTSVSASALQSSLDKLTISPEAHEPSILTNPIANSTSASYRDDTSKSAPPLAKPVQSISTPSPPPPTPASPTVRTKATASNSPYHTQPPYGMNGSVDGAATGAGRSSTPTGRSGAADPDKRPEKTTSTAARLIAAGLGQRPPKRTEEERKYDQAMRVQEKKKRDAAKAEEQKKKDDLEKAKKSIWED